MPTRALILKVANDWLKGLQKNESAEPEKQASKERWKIRCMDVKRLGTEFVFFYDSCISRDGEREKPLKVFTS